MHRLKFKISLTFCLSLMLFGSSTVFAETIRLKTGETVEGKIVEKTADYIKLDVGGVTVTYFSDEVEKSEGGTTQTAPPNVFAETDEVSALLQQGSQFYTNREFEKAIRSFEMALPRITDANLKTDILFMLSSSYLEKGVMAYITNKDDSFYQKALGYADQCLALNPRYWYALANIATVYTNTNELEKADSYYAKAEQYVSSNDPGYEQLIAQHALVRAALKLRKEQGK